MATIDEEWPRLKFLAEHKRGAEKIHVVFLEQEARERIANAGPKPKTKFVFETDSPEAYSQLNFEKDRWIKAVGNKSVAVTLLIMAWQKYTDDDLRLAAEGMEEIGAVESLVPKAVIPPMH